MRKRPTFGPGALAPGLMHPRTLMITILPAIFAACGSPGVDKTSRRSIPDNYVQGSFVVTTEATTSESRLSAITSDVASRMDCKASQPEVINWGDPGGEGASVISQSMRNTFHVKFENCDLSREGTSAILSAFGEDTGILSAEAEAIATAGPVVENDPHKGSQTHLPFIRRDSGCEVARAAGKPVIVAVIDSGVDINHPDLRNMILRDGNGRVIGANFVGSGAQMPPDDNVADGTGHGTHVAGLVAAEANNQVGVVGVAACANVRIMPVRVLNNEGSGSSIEIERGVKWAADQGAQIINMSLGHTSTTQGWEPSFRRTLYDNLAARDIIVMAAAGNDGYENGVADSSGMTRWHFPSSYDNVISVAATNSSGTLTSFSNRGKRVDIAAPGYQVLATIPGGSYARMSGTSMASPVAAGALAVALASAQPGLADGLERVDNRTVSDLLSQAILSDARLDNTQVSSGGVINVEQLVKLMNLKFPETQHEPGTPAQPGDGDGDVNQPGQPTTPTPVVTPVPDRPAEPVMQPAAMSFAGLKDGQKAGWPQKLSVQNLPKGTAAVYFYWGSNSWSFSKVYVKAGASAVTDPDAWFLYGSRTLKAVAFSKSGRVVGVARIQLKGH